MSPSDACERCGHERRYHTPGELCLEGVPSFDEDGTYEDDWPCECPQFVEPEDA